VALAAADLAGVGEQDARHGAAAAEIGGPVASVLRTLDQAACLLLAATVEIGVIKRTLCACWCEHNMGIFWASSPGEVGAAAGVDPDYVPALHEQRDLDLEPGFGDDGLVGASGGISLYSHLGL